MEKEAGGMSPPFLSSSKLLRLSDCTTCEYVVEEMGYKLLKNFILLTPAEIAKRLTISPFSPFKVQFIIEIQIYSERNSCCLNFEPSSS